MCPAKIRVSVIQGRKELKSLPERKNVGRGADWGGEGRSGEFLLGWMSWAGDHLLPSSLGLHHCAVLSQQLSRIHILLYHRAHVSHSRVTGWGSRSYWVPTPWGWAVIISQLLCGPCDFFLNSHFMDCFLGQSPQSRADSDRLELSPLVPLAAQ